VSDLLRAELLKLRTTRTFAALVGSSLAISLLVVVLITTLDSNFDTEDLRQTFATDFTPLFIVLLGVIGMTGEWRHRTITSTVLAAPDRLRLLAAKVIAYAVAGIVLSAIVTLAIMLVGTLILSSRGETTAGLGDLADVLWRNLLIAGLLGALGVCIGGLVRNQVVAIVGLLFISFVIEPTLLALAPKVGQFGPFSGAPNAILGLDPGSDEVQLTLGAALLVMLGWIGLGYAAAGVLLKRRDLV
jgi:hypothetical protein